MKKSIVFQISNTRYEEFVAEKAYAYEVRMTSRKPDDRWRNNHVLLVVAESVEMAVDLAKELYPDDAIIDQVVLRSKSMDVIIQGELT